jgi:hypothetical protein
VSRRAGSRRREQPSRVGARRIRVRTTLALLCLCAGCLRGSFAPGLLREDWSQPRRDPDPTRNPTEELTGNPWAEEAPAGGTASGRGGPEPTRGERISRAAATVLAMVASGWTPLLVYQGTFEEDPAQRRRHREGAPPPDAVEPADADPDGDAED